MQFWDDRSGSIIGTLYWLSHLEIDVISWSVSFLVPEPDKTKPSDSSRHQVDQKTRLPSVTCRAYQPCSDTTTETRASFESKKVTEPLRLQEKRRPCPSTKKARPLSVLCVPTPLKMAIGHWRSVDTKDGKEISLTLMLDWNFKSLS